MHPPDDLGARGRHLFLALAKGVEPRPGLEDLILEAARLADRLDALHVAIRVEGVDPKLYAEARHHQLALRTMLADLAKHNPPAATSKDSTIDQLAARRRARNTGA